MTDEFYHKNIFGDVVDANLSDTEEKIYTLTKKKPEFNLFIFTDAVGAKNKREAWVQYQKALARGMNAEDVFWRGLIWEIKNLLIASKTKNVSESGLNPFVYQKAKGFVRNFKPGELEKLSESLVIGYHNARRGIGEMDSLIEKILLKL